MKVALLTYSTKPRGSVIHTLELAQALHKLGHEPCVFALDKDGKGFHRDVAFKTCAVPAQPCEGGTDALVKQRIGEFVSFFESDFERGLANYDIHHAQDCLSANALAILREKGIIPRFVRTVHHIENFKSSYLIDRQEKSIRQSDRCLCVSQFWQQALQRSYGIAAHRVINGVSDRFSPQPNGKELTLAKHYGIRSDGPVYLTVGGIEPRKNSINLLKAFRRVQAERPTAQLVIAGGATLFDYQPYRDEFMALVDTYGLRDCLILTGIVSDESLPVLYRLADAFVFPSVQEGWGLVVLEAIASNLPVLTSNQAPFTEFLSSESALLVNPHSPDDIADSMLKLLEDQVSQSLIHSAQSIANSYRWSQSAKMHLDLYQQLA